MHSGSLNSGCDLKTSCKAPIRRPPNTSIQETCQIRGTDLIRECFHAGPELLYFCDACNQTAVEA